MKRILLPLGAILLVSWHQATAQTNGNWNVNANGNWSTPTNWSSNPNVPGGDGSIVNITFDTTAIRTVTIDTTSRTVGQLTIGDPDGSHRYDLAASGGAGLIFQNGGNAAQLNFTSTALTGTISAPVSLAANLVISNNSANQQTISSTISSSTAGLKTIEIAGAGSGLVNLSGAITDGTGSVGMTINSSSGGVILGALGNTFSGPFNLQAGRLVLIASYRTGTGTFNITGGSIESNGSNTRRIDQNVTLNGEVSLGNLTNAGLVYFDAPARTLSLLGNSTISTVSAARIDHIITGAANASLTKSGSSTLSLVGVHTYAGQTTVSAGTLIIASGSINSSSQVTVSAGAVLTNNGAGFTTALAFAPGATLSGSAAFTPASMTLVADLAGGDASFSSINTGTTSVVRSGNMEFTLTNATAGNYDVFNGSAISGSFSSITIGGVALNDLGGGVFSGAVGSFAYSFDNASNILSLTLVVIPEPSAWMLLTIAGMFALLARRRVAFRS